VTKVTRGSSERFFKVAACEGMRTAKDLISAASSYTVNALANFFNDFLFKRINFDLFEKDRALKDNLVITLKMAVSAQSDSASTMHGELTLLPFKIINENGIEESQKIEDCENDIGIPGMAHDRLRQDGTWERISFTEGGKVQHVVDALSDKENKHLEQAVNNVIKRVVNEDGDEHSIKHIRYAIDYAEKHPDDFADIGNELADYKFILMNNSDDLTYGQLKLEVERYRFQSKVDEALYQLQAKHTSLDEKNEAASFLLTNSIRLNNKNHVTLAAKHIVNNAANFPMPVSEKAMRHILMNTKGCEKLSLVDAARHILQNRSNFNKVSAKAANLLILKSTKGCEQMSFPDAVRYIMTNDKKRGKESISSAVHFLYHHAISFDKPEDELMHAKAIISFGMKCSNDDYIKATKTILLNQNGCEGKSIEDAVLYVITHSSECSKASIKCAFHHIKHNPNSLFDSIDKLVRANAIIGIDMPCTDDEFIKATRKIIRNTEGCTGLKLTEAAQSILSNQTAYSINSVRSAAHYIFNNPALFTNDVFTVAKKYIAEKFPANLTIRVSQIVINQNLGYFLTPNTDYSRFESAFQTKDEIAAITEYTNGLGDLLLSNIYFDDLYTIPAELSPIGEEVKLSFYNIWKLQRESGFNFFELVLKNNLNVAKFILDHSDHPAIQIWNTFNSPSQTTIELEDETTFEFIPPNKRPELSGHATKPALALQ
jgi:hypothetical protein